MQKIRALFHRYPLLFALITGALTSLALAPLYLLPVLAVGIPVLFYGIKSAPTSRKALWFGWFWGFGYFGASLYWIAFSLHVDIARLWWLAPFVALGLPAVLAFYTGFTAYILNRFVPLNSSLFNVYAAGLMGFAELIRGFAFTGFPWALLGHSWGFYTPALQLTSVVGIYGLSLLTWLIFGLMTSHRRAMIGLFILGLMISFGHYRLKHATVEIDDSYNIAVIQPNIAQIDKWNPRLAEAHFDKFITESYNAIRLDKKNIVIWPETAITFALDAVPERRDRIHALIADENTVLIAGAVGFDYKENHDYDVTNSISFLFRPAVDKPVQELRYDKAHLVPFGEYVPFADYLSAFRIGDMGFKAGHGLEAIQTLNFPLRFLPLVCYEAIFPDSINRLAGAFDIMINVTNDAWYLDSRGPYQHHDMVKIRAIEQGTPLIRAANTGISSVIDPYGRVFASAPLNNQQIVAAPLLKHLQNANIYAKYGNLIYYGMLGLCLLSFVFETVYGTRKKPKGK